jgi:pimeloyl-ACP methyl ester carboxylesterase
MAQQAAIAQDLMDFMAALGLQRVALSGYDWGGRAAFITAILAPEKVRALVTIGGYNVQNTLAGPRPVTALEERSRWYQWYFNTEQGQVGLKQNRRDICRLLWEEWSPTWHFDDATYNLTAPSFDNPDFVPIVIHSYRHRHRNAPGDPQFDAVEQHLATRPPITVPTIVLHGADDTVSRPRRSEGDMAMFPPGTARHVVAGAGHFMPRERPNAVVEALQTLLAQTSA